MKTKIKPTVWAVFVCLLVGQIGHAQTVEEAQARYVYLAQTIMQQPTVVPDDDPVSEICDNCNGRGKVGDGTIMVTCPVCDGTGKKTKTQPLSTGWPPKDFFDSIPEKKTSVVPRKHALLEVYTTDPCDPCMKLKAEALPGLKSSNWEVKILQDRPIPKDREGQPNIYPTTRVWYKGKVYPISGYNGLNDYYRKIKTIIGG